MKKIVLLFLFISSFASEVFAERDTLVHQLYNELNIEITQKQDYWLDQLTDLNVQLSEIQNAITILEASTYSNPNQLVRMLIHKDKIRDQLSKAEEDFQIELSRIRYKKGIELIKMIYEKILGLDHHFTSLQTYQNVVTLSNPNNFAEFKDAKNVISERVNKKNAIQLPSLLESNPFVSMTYSMVASFFGNEDKRKKEQDLSKIACILDFTLRMNNDLNTIYYETEFLKGHNQSLKEACIELFKDYTKVVKYHTTLPECRKEDDWEAVDEKLVTYMQTLAENNTDPLRTRQAYKMQVDLEFSIDRLMQFMDEYSAFISQGEKYYQKFQTILNNYSNEDVCQAALPRQFESLRKDIEISILKFTEAYNISELHGSKLKDLMYGLSD